MKTSNWWKGLFQFLWVVLLVYFFLVSIKLMGGAFKLFGKGVAETLIERTANPFLGLFIGILATSIVQSSSCTTSIVVGLVAAGVLPISHAIPIIMGANIGTTVTNTLVSLAHIHRKEEIRNAFSIAVAHDMFNICTVIILFPLQLKFHFLEKLSSFLTHTLFIEAGGIKLINPLKIILSPTLHLLKHLCFSQPVVMLIVSLLILFFCLRAIVATMRGAVAVKLEHDLHRFIFNNELKSFLVGLGLTVIVQSSSIVTSLIVPLGGARILTVEESFPYERGANIGTTVTAILASFATGKLPAIIIAFSHLIFNVIGTIIFTPLKRVPIRMAKMMGNAVAERRWVAILYVGVVFFLIPLILIFIGR
jgi:sodium-dependent phosphate cotransporter